MERRNFIKTATCGALATSLSPLAASQSDAVRQPEYEKPAQLKDTSFFWVRGFNYQPGYGRGHGIDVWCDFKPDIIERELSRGKELFPEMNAVRIWLSFDAFLAEPEKIPENFTKYIDIIGKVGLRVMPCIFNGWHSIPDFGGMTPESVRYTLRKNIPGKIDYTLRFVDALLDRHADDNRIFAWDLCNEPFQNGGEEDYLQWLKLLYEHIKERNEKTCLTIGMNGGSGKMKQIEAFCDLLSTHPYFGFKNSDLIDHANNAGKPMIASEIGWGKLDDAERVELLHAELSSCIDRKVGFLIHALSYSRAADLHHPEDGPVGAPGYMACVEKDGAIRPGHEMIRNYLKINK